MLFDQQAKFKHPVMFGSITDWKVIEMVPTEIYLLSIFKDELLKFPMRIIPNLDSVFKLEVLINRFYCNMSDERIQIVRDIFRNFGPMFKYIREQALFLFFRQVQLFNLPEHKQTADSKCLSYMLQREVKPGNHSIIVYEPASDTFLCKKILVHLGRTCVLG